MAHLLVRNPTIISSNILHVLAHQSSSYCIFFFSCTTYIFNLLSLLWLAVKVRLHAIIHKLEHALSACSLLHQHRHYTSVIVCNFLYKLLVALGFTRSSVISVMSKFRSPNPSAFWVVGCSIVQVRKSQNVLFSGRNVSSLFQVTSPVSLANWWTFFWANTFC